ncbi:hypothetical protein GN956_G10518 [Arapaima gigas]
MQAFGAPSSSLIRAQMQAKQSPSLPTALRGWTCQLPQLMKRPHGGNRVTPEPTERNCCYDRARWLSFPPAMFTVSP